MVRGSGGFFEIHILAVEARRHVTGLAAAFQLVVERADHHLLDGVAAIGMDGMGDVGVQLEPRVAVAVMVALAAVFVETAAAVVAVPGAEVVLFAAAPAMVGELARGLLIGAWSFPWALGFGL